MTNNQSAVIYKRDSAGRIRTWQFEVEGDKYRTVAGLQGGALTTSAWTVCEPKSQPTAEAQALFEANAELQKKLDREYRASIGELDSVPVSPMLAKDFTKVKKIVYPVFAQPKLDGIRATISRHGAFTREYQRHFNVEHIIEALAPVFEKHPDLIFDGELYNHDLKDDFNTIASIVRKQNVDEERRAKARELIQYHVYDVIAPGPFCDRQSLLQNVLPDHEALKCVHTVIIDNKSYLDEFYAVYLEQGYEGQMVRLDAPYEADKRSDKLLKRKEFITGEFPIKRIEEGKGNWAGFAKRVVLDIPTAPDGEVGAGMRGTQDFARELLERERAGTAPKQATVRYFGVTPDGSLRFPVAIDFHDKERVD